MRAMRASSDVSVHEHEVNVASESVSDVDEPISISNTTPFPSSLLIDSNTQSFSDPSSLYFALLIVKQFCVDEMWRRGVVERVKEEKETPLSVSIPSDASMRLVERVVESVDVNAICEIFTAPVVDVMER